VEYIKVVFCRDKKVLIDGKACGATNLVLEIEAGTHTICLEAPVDFQPAEINIVLDSNQTSSLMPKEISFETL